VVGIRGVAQGDSWWSLSDPKPGGWKLASSISIQPSKLLEDGIVTPRSPSVNLKGGGIDLAETLGEIWKNGEKKPPSPSPRLS
jgi:hypothetical protein